MTLNIVHVLLQKFFQDSSKTIDILALFDVTNDAKDLYMLFFSRNGLFLYWIRQFILLITTFFDNKHWQYDVHQKQCNFRLEPVIAFV